MSDDHIIKDKVTYLGKIDYRGKAVTFGIKENDRTKHMYVIGKSGMGKSTLLENLAIQDIANGEGICVIDPHGSMAEKLLDHIPEHRVKDVVYFAPFDAECPVGLNMLERVPADKRYLVASGLMSAFKKIFTDGDGKATFSARMEYVLNYIILALLENDNQTLLGINRMLFDKDYRKAMVANVTDPTVKDFWVNEYANYTEKTTQELAPSIQNKVGQFVSNPLIRNIIGQQKTSFNVRDLMDNQKILIVNLSKGKVGEGNANLLGSLLITKIYLAAMSRADIDPYEAEQLPPFYFYVDEFQNFANESFASILSEARKYKLALAVAHQYVEQMTDEVKAAVFGNVGTMITFRIGATDAEVFEKEFAPYFILDDFVNLSARQIYVRLMIDGQGSKPFSAQTLPPIQKPPQSFANAVIAHSRATYGKPKAVVEEEVQSFYHALNTRTDVKKKVPDQSEQSSETSQDKQVKVLEIASGSRDETRPSERPKYDSPRRSEQSPVTRYDQTKRTESPRADAPRRSESVGADQSRRNETAYQERGATTSAPRTREGDRNPTNSSPKTVYAKTESTPSHSETAQTFKESSPRRSPPADPPIKFDDAPPMSLKEALAKALSEAAAPVAIQESIESSTSDAVVPVSVISSPAVLVDEQKNSHPLDAGTSAESHQRASEDKEGDTKVEENKREVSEDVLRKLLDD